MLGKPFMTTQHLARPFDVREPTARASIRRQDQRNLKPWPAARAAADCLEGVMKAHARRQPGWRGDFAPASDTHGAKKAPERTQRHDA